MARLTILKLTQRIMSALDSDEIESIADTNEAYQVANTIRSCYRDICAEMDLSFQSELVNLYSALSVEKPVQLQIPPSVARIEWVKYGVRTADTGTEYTPTVFPTVTIMYKDVTYLDPLSFVNTINQRNPDDDNVFQMLYGPDNVTLLIYNDRPPRYWTSFNDDYIIFDAWDSDVESTIQAENTQVYVTKAPGIELNDTAEINLPANLIPYLHSMAEARCFAFFKQQSNPKSEQREGRQRIRSQRGKWRQGRLVHRGPDFGK